MNNLKNMKIKILILIIILLSSSAAYSSGNPQLAGDGPNHNPPQFFTTASSVYLNANNISAFFWRSGVFNQNNLINNYAGMEWIRGSGKTPWFTSGLSIGCYINNDLRLAA